MEYLYSPLERILVHCRVTPGIKTTGTHLFTCERVEFLAQEHNTMSRAMARTRIAGRALTMEPLCLYYIYLVYSKQLLLNSSRTLSFLHSIPSRFSIPRSLPHTTGLRKGLGIEPKVPWNGALSCPL